MKTRIRKAVVEVAEVDIEGLVGRIAELKGMERQIAAQLDESLRSAREFYEPALGQVRKEIEEVSGLAQRWAEGHRERFATRKSLELAHGTIGFRTGTPKLKLLRGWTWESVLAAITDLWGRFVRVKQEVDKEGILAAYAQGRFLDGDLDNIGVKVVQEETFFVEPKLTEVESRVCGLKLRLKS